MLVLCMHDLIGSSQKLCVSGAICFVDKDTEAQRSWSLYTLEPGPKLHLIHTELSPERLQYTAFGSWRLGPDNRRSSGGVH